MIVNINVFLEKDKKGELIKETRNKKINELINPDRNISEGTENIIKYLKYLHDTHTESLKYLAYINEYLESFEINIPNEVIKNIDPITKEMDDFRAYLENLAVSLSDLEN